MQNLSMKLKHKKIKWNINANQKICQRLSLLFIEHISTKFAWILFKFPSITIFLSFKPRQQKTSILYHLTKGIGEIESEGEPGTLSQIINKNLFTQIHHLLFCFSSALIHCYDCVKWNLLIESQNKKGIFEAHSMIIKGFNFHLYRHQFIKLLRAVHFLNGI